MNRTLIAHAITNAGNTFKRFFVTFLFAIVGTIAAIILSETAKNLDYHLRNLVVVCVLGISFSVGLTLFAERNKCQKGVKGGLQLMGVGLLAGCYFTLPQEWNAIHFFKVILFAISLHCFVAFSAFIKRGTAEGFWQFNKSLFIRILASCLYTGVLFIGLMLAIVVVEILFGMKMHKNILVELWIFLAGIFNTWFFVSGIPSNLDELDHSKDYPKGLKVFSQFVLIPLVTIYFVILYAYMMKIIVQWQFPKGVVSYLVLGFSIFGILSLLLIYPLQNLEAEKWIKIYTRWFYRALLPLVVLLFMAIGLRIAEYGITINRYYIILLACWLMGISIYLLINRLHNIKAIPISLCLISLLSSFGPWGAFEVSKKNQLERLVTLLKSHGVLVEGKIIKPKKDIPGEDQEKLASIIGYLSSTYGHQVLMPFLSEEQKRMLDLKNHYDFIQEMESILEINVKAYSSQETKSNLASFSYEIERNPLLKIYSVKGYDYFFEDSLFVDEKRPYSRNASDNSWNVVADGKEIRLNYKNETLTLSFKDLYEKLKSLYKLKHHKNVKEEDATFILEGQSVGIKIIFNLIDGHFNQKTGKVNASYIGFQYFIRIK